MIIRQPFEMSEVDNCLVGLFPVFPPYTKPGLDINVCSIPVKTDVGQVDLVSRLSDWTSEKMTILPFEGYFLR